MKLLIFSDIHGDWTALDALLDIEADYYIAAGDQVTWGKGLDRCGELLRRRAERMYVLPGNHESADQVASLCARYDLHDFHGRHFQAGRWHIAGLGYSNPTPFDTPGEYSEAQLYDRLMKFADLRPMVLVCHTPPHGTTLDCIRSGVHAGSKSVRTFIETYQPEHFFCGHIHEAAGVTAEMGGTRCVNVGKQGYLLELSE